MIAPGASAKHTKIRHHFRDYRKTAKEVKLRAEMASKKTADGYVIEMLLPWANVGVKPKIGRIFGIQFFIIDSDRKGTRVKFHIF